MHRVRLTDLITSGKDKELFDNFSKFMEIPEVCSNNEPRAALKCLIPLKKKATHRLLEKSEKGLPRGPFW